MVSVAETLVGVADRLERIMDTLSDAQSHLDTDVQTMVGVLADFGNEWSAISDDLKAALAAASAAGSAPAIDLTKLDALASQAQQMDATWKAQVDAQAAGGATTTAGAPQTGTTPVGS